VLNTSDGSRSTIDTNRTFYSKPFFTSRNIKDRNVSMFFNKINQYYKRMTSIANIYPRIAGVVETLTTKALQFLKISQPGINQNTTTKV